MSNVGFGDMAKELAAEMRRKRAAIRAEESEWYRELGRIWLVVVENSATHGHPMIRKSVFARRREIGWMPYGQERKDPAKREEQAAQSLERYKVRLDTFAPAMREYLADAYRSALR